MQRVTPRPSIPSSGRGRPARGLAGLGAIAGPRALPPGSPRSPSFPAPAPPRYKARSTVRTMVAEAGFVRGGQCGTRGGPPLSHGGPRRESFGLRGRVVPHGCSRDPPACEEPSNAKRLVPIRRDGGTGRRDGLKSPRRLGLFRKWLAPPSQQWRRAARPATNALTRKGGADAGVPIDPFPRSRRGPPAPFLQRTPAPRMLRKLNRRRSAGVAEWQTQRT